MNSEGSDTARLDVWLWAMRIYKTRGDAAAACRAGVVKINDQPAKPARPVHVGDLVLARQGIIRKTLRVIGSPKSRVGPKLVAQFAEDLTPPEDYAMARAQRVQQILSREPGAGRPTKKDRRAIDRLFEEPD
ncbi:MAG TPA: S4 domain-containing protein [Opitutaceae bacterium]|nr:S4 domain-containing protein [Opitutaceae bacterium]